KRNRNENPTRHKCRVCPVLKVHCFSSGIPFRAVFLIIWTQNPGLYGWVFLVRLDNAETVILLSSIGANESKTSLVFKVLHISRKVLRGMLVSPPKIIGPGGHWACHFMSAQYHKIYSLIPV